MLGKLACLTEAFFGYTECWVIGALISCQTSENSTSTVRFILDEAMIYWAIFFEQSSAQFPFGKVQQYEQLVKQPSSGATI